MGQLSPDMFFFSIASSILMPSSPDDGKASFTDFYRAWTIVRNIIIEMGDAVIKRIKARTVWASILNATGTAATTTNNEMEAISEDNREMHVTAALLPLRAPFNEDG